VLLPAGGAGAAPGLRPLGWYRARLREALPAAAMILAFAAVVLALLAVTMFALQRDQPGM
jgi:hypothetical protein